jgi:hypothetical protein
MKWKPDRFCSRHEQLCRLEAIEFCAVIVTIEILKAVVDTKSKTY